MVFMIQRLNIANFFLRECPFNREKVKEILYTVYEFHAEKYLGVPCKIWHEFECWRADLKKF
jgi:hypothetical protein